MAEQQKVEVVSVASFSAFIKKFQAHIDKLVPKHFSAERAINLAVSAYSRDSKLRRCTVPSIINSVVLSSQLGLEFNNPLGHAALIPYGSWSEPDDDEDQAVATRGQGREILCSFQPMYKGLVNLALRSPRVDNVQAKPVYEADGFDIEYGSNQRLYHKPFIGPSSDRGALIGAYCIVMHTQGRQPTFLFMTADDIEHVQTVTNKSRKMEGGRKKETPAWKNWRDQMYLKTATKRHLKLEELNAETSRAIGLDDQHEAGVAQEQVVDIDYSVLDEVVKAEQQGGRVTVAMPDATRVRPSQNPNRGHDNTMKLAADIARETGAAEKTSEPPKRELTQEEFDRRLQEERAAKAKDLPDRSDFPSDTHELARFSHGDYLKVKGALYQFSEHTGSFTQVEAAEPPKEAARGGLFNNLGGQK